jgi:hypothetical protein
VRPFELRNVTLCGQPQVFAKQFGLVHRELAEGTYRRMVLTGFGAGVDVRDSAASLVFTNNVLWSPAFGAHVGEDESVDDDDEGFDEETLVTTLLNDNVVADPGLACVGGGVFTPTADFGLPGDLQEDPEGFFVDAPYVGAVAPGESWLTGAWVVF